MASTFSSPNSVRTTLDYLDLSMGNLLTAGKEAESSPTDDDPISRVITADDKRLPLQQTRSLILGLAALVGDLSSLALNTFPLDPEPSEHYKSAEASPALSRCMAQILTCLLDIASSLSLDLQTAILKKMELNHKKYPVELCRGKAGKYTDYSKATGITKETGQSTAHLEPGKTRSASTSPRRLSPRPSLNFIDSLPSLTTKVRNFAEVRNWSRFHLPRNITLALLGEVGELAELLQWKGDSEQTLTTQELDKLGQEIADVSIYLIRLADICGVSLEMAVVSLSIDNCCLEITTNDNNQPAATEKVE